MRCSGQFTTLTPVRYRDPITTSNWSAAAAMRRQVLRVVGEVGVHLEDQVGAGCERMPQAVDVGPPESARSRPMHDLDAARDGSRASSSAIAPVPSGEPSSTTSSRKPGCARHRPRESADCPSRCRWASRRRCREACHVTSCAADGRATVVRRPPAGAVSRGIAALPRTAAPRSARKPGRRERPRPRTGSAGPRHSGCVTWATTFQTP